MISKLFAFSKNKDRHIILSLSVWVYTLPNGRHSTPNHQSISSRVHSVLSPSPKATCVTKYIYIPDSDQRLISLCGLCAALVLYRWKPTKCNKILVTKITTYLAIRKQRHSMEKDNFDVCLWCAGNLMQNLCKIV